MKKYLLAAAMFGLAATGANAQAVTNVWQGNLVVQSVTGTCTTANGNAAVGDNYRVQYKPSGLPGNLADDVLIMVGARAAYALRVAGGRIIGTGNSFQTGFTGGSVNVFGFGSNIAPPATPNASFSGVTTTPGTIAESTQYLTLTGTFATWTGISGCSATVTAVMVKRVTPPPS